MCLERRRPSHRDASLALSRYLRRHAPRAVGEQRSMVEAAALVIEAQAFGPGYPAQMQVLLTFTDPTFGRDSSYVRLRDAWIAPRP